MRHGILFWSKSMPIGQNLASNIGGVAGRQRRDAMLAIGAAS